MDVPIRVARIIHLISAFWILGLALLIVADVSGRQILSQPIPGTKEMIQNSVVSITFLQLPLAVYTGSMLRTTIFADAMPELLKRLLRTMAGLLGVAFFVGLAVSTWEPFWDAYRIGEYEGEGALRVPTWPVRGSVLVLASFSALAYAMMIVFDWRGRLIDDLEAPGASTPPPGR